MGVSPVALVLRAYRQRETTDMTDETDEFRRLEEDRRLDQLEKRLDRVSADEARRTGSDRQPADAGTRVGNRILAELIGGLAGGALLGWLADKVFGTWPWGFLILMALGIVVAFRNIIRISNAVARDSAKR